MMFEGLNINAAPWGSTPVTASPPQLGSSDPYPEKKELCRFYVNGGCTKGSTCQYSHDLVIEAPDGSTGGGGFILNRGVANAHHASPGVPRSGATSSGIGASPLTATPPTLGWQGGAASGGVSWGVQGMPSDGSQQQHTAVLLSQQHSGGYAAYGDPSQGGGGGYGDLHRTGSMAHANSYGDLSSAAAGAGGDGGALAFNGAQSSVFAARLSQQQSPAPTSDYPATTAEHHQAILRRFTYGGATTASSAMMPSYFPTSTAPNGRVDYVDPSSQPTGALLFAPHHLPTTGTDENAAVIAAYLQQQQQGGYYVATDGTTVSSSGLAVYPAGGGVQPVILASTADLFPALPGAAPSAMAPQSATLYATTTAPAPQAVMTQQPMTQQQLGAEDSYAQKLQRAAQQQQQQQAAQQQQQLTPATPTGYGQQPKPQTAMPGLTPYPAAGPAPGMPGYPGQPQTPGAATPQNPAPVPATFDIDASLAALLGRGNNSQAAAAAAIMTAAATANRNTGSTQAITELQRILSRISAGDTASLSTGSSPQTSPVKPPASENKASAGAIGAPVATPAAQPTPYVDPAVIDAAQAGPRDRKAAGAEEPSNGAASQSPAGGNSPSAGAGYRGGYRRGGGGGGGGYDRRESRDGQHGGRRAGEDDYTEAYDDRRPASAGYPIGRVNNAGRNGSGSSEPQPAAAPSGGKGGKGGAVATPEPAHHADPRSAAGYRPQSGGRGGGGQRETGYVVPGPRSATQATASSGPIAVPRSAAAAAAAAAASKPAAAQAPAPQQGRAPVGGAQPNPSGGRGKNGGGRGR